MPETARKALGTSLEDVRAKRGALRIIAVFRRRGVSFLGLALLFSLTAVPASARELRIHSFHVDLDVMPDSTLTVSETIGVEFVGTWNGIYRTIPAEYLGPGGFNYSLYISDVSA